MQWDDEGVVLALRRHGEGSAVVEIFTRAHGRHLGLIRGARRESAMLQAGNSVAATWRGRLSEHLGFYRLEPARIRTGALMDDPAALAALRAECALLALVLPEREPHPALYAALLALLDSLGAGVAWDPEILRFELKLLEDLGFGPEPAEAQAVLAEGARDLPAALALTARLLERHLLHPHGRALPPARADLPAALARAKMTREENQAAR